ncbi:hypothetical protein BSKO_01916 [Bryopsis sp. KO-2023]|nr:hypothetical protein BSKO_01916 [Bryopsis sp. KO-2023]
MVVGTLASLRPIGVRGAVGLRLRLAHCRVACTRTSDADVQAQKEPRYAFDFVGTPFEELNLTESKVDGVRVRQHANPLRSNLQIPCKALPWSDVFSDPSRPLILDAGCGSGRFLLLLAKQDESCKFNYLGTDIRDKLIKRANEWASYLSTESRVHFVKANITISLATMLETYPGPIHTIAIQFSDPHFKSKRRKRHIVQKQLVEEAAKVLKPGGRVFFQSDVESVSAYIRDMFDLHGNEEFKPSSLHGTKWEQGNESGSYQWGRVPWLRDNPLGAPTERELRSLDQGLAVTRMLLVRR